MKKKSVKPEANDVPQSTEDAKKLDPKKDDSQAVSAKYAEINKSAVEQSTATSAASTSATADNSTTTKKNKKSKVSTEAKPGKTRRPVFILILLLLVIIATGFAVYDFWFLQKLVPLNAQLADTQQKLESRIGQLERGLQQSQRKLSEESQARQRAESEHQALNSAMQRVTEKLGRNTLTWRMAEVEYLLTVANHRLTLAQDRETAIAVFETADSRLESMGDPLLLKVRKRIASELAALRSVADVDIPGLALQVGSLAEIVDQLPLLDKKRIAAATKKSAENTTRGWREILITVWQDLKSLVQVRRHEQPTEPLLPPNQAWFLYQNLQLKLEQARLAILQHNTALFHQSLGEASDWVKNYFDIESASVGNLQKTLSTLRTIELQTPLPDVSGSLRELRSLMHAKPNKQGAAPLASSKSTAEEKEKTGNKVEKNAAKKSTETDLESSPTDQSADAKGTAAP